MIKFVLIYGFFVNIAFSQIEFGNKIKSEDFNNISNNIVQDYLFKDISVNPLNYQAGDLITSNDLNSFFNQFDTYDLSNELHTFQQGDLIQSNLINENFNILSTIESNIYFSSCLEIKNKIPSSTSGIYTIDEDGYLNPKEPEEVYCEMDTDGGGWRLVMNQADNNHMSSSAINIENLKDTTSKAKESDLRIREIALNSNKEALIQFNTDSYIFRYTVSQWESFDNDSGWKNIVFDAKDSSGNWIINACNGHFNNRGFSTYSDIHSNTCPYIYSGNRFYFFSRHTTGTNTSKAGVKIYIR